MKKLTFIFAAIALICFCSCSSEDNIGKLYNNDLTDMLNKNNSITSGYSTRTVVDSLLSEDSLSYTDIIRIGEELDENISTFYTNHERAINRTRPGISLTEDDIDRLCLDEDFFEKTIASAFSPEVKACILKSVNPDIKRAEAINSIHSTISETNINAFEAFALGCLHSTLVYIEIIDTYTDNPTSNQHSITVESCKSEYKTARAKCLAMCVFGTIGSLFTGNAIGLVVAGGSLYECIEDANQSYHRCLQLAQQNQ